MIELKNVTKSYFTPKGKISVFKNLNFQIPSNRNVAIIGRNGAGKSTLMRLLGGQDVPDSGKVVSAGTISWPVGLSGGFQGSLSGRENVKFVARVHGLDQEGIKHTVDFVSDFAEIGKYFDMPVNTYSSGMRGRVAFGLSMAFKFDYYLVDEALSVGDAQFRDKAQKLFESRTGQSNLILVTHGMGQVRKLCDYVILLKHGGVIEHYSDVEQGISAYQSN